MLVECRQVMTGYRWTDGRVDGLEGGGAGVVLQC